MSTYSVTSVDVVEEWTLAEVDSDVLTWPLETDGGKVLSLQLLLCAEGGFWQVLVTTQGGQAGRNGFQNKMSKVAHTQLTAVLSKPNLAIRKIDPASHNLALLAKLWSIWNVVILRVESMAIVAMICKGAFLPSHWPRYCRLSSSNSNAYGAVPVIELVMLAFYIDGNLTQQRSSSKPPLQSSISRTP